MLEFSLVKKSIPVVLTTTDGSKKTYSLREMSGKDRDTYLTRLQSKFARTPDGKAQSVKSFDGLQAILLTLCLYTEEDKLVEAAEVQEFPSTVLTALFEKAQEINALNEEGAQEAKND